ncbi:MAG: glycosyltransferase family 9 protein [Bacteroidetes bacterium]|nr:glycosyltransferase family 9 protein [Bacteroidota bacterium]
MSTICSAEWIAGEERVIARVSGAILIIQTAYAGDLILTLPLIEEAALQYPEVPIDVLCIPSTVDLLANNPFVRRCIVYDKRKGRPPLHRLLRDLSREGYSLCLCPHRSFRSALLAFASRAPKRITFDRSAATWLFTDVFSYREDWHEVERNRSLLSEGQQPVPTHRTPRLYPSEQDYERVASLLRRCDGPSRYICVAPGSVWSTKRWTEEGFAALIRHFSSTHTVFLIGGKEDHERCSRIARGACCVPPSGSEWSELEFNAATGGDAGVVDVNADFPVEGRQADAVELRDSDHCIINVAGELGFLASAALIENAELLVSNDSAPVHLASAMRTPVVEIYGATTPDLGFSPYGVPHRFAQREDLDCRPCAEHGGRECPIGTLVCMRELYSRQVIETAEELLPSSPERGSA